MAFKFVAARSLVLLLLLDETQMKDGHADADGEIERE